MNLPIIFIPGPIVAITAIVFKTFFCSSFDKEENFLVKLSSLPKNSLTWGNKLLPKVIAMLFNLFLAIVIWDSVVSYLLFASLVKAVFSFHAELPFSIALLNKFPAFAALNKESRNLVSVRPISVNIEIALSPFSSAFPNPCIKAIIAPAASSFHAFWNSSADLPEIAAKSCKFVPAVIKFFNSVEVIPISCANPLKPLESLADNNSNSLNDSPVFFKTAFSLDPPFSTATCILTIAFEIAEPPISASIPTELKAVAKPNTSPSDKLTCLPAPASLIAIFTISDSVVA